MCRYFSYWGERPHTVNDWLTKANNSLLQQSINDNSNRPNADGWGIVYKKDQQWQAVRNTIPAFEDPLFEQTAANLETEFLLAHVRRKSQGPALPNNTHPFQHNNWAFMHNGNIPELNLRKAELQLFLKDNCEIPTNGDTDSEYYFKYILKRLSQLAYAGKSEILRTLHQINTHLIEKTPAAEQHMLALNFVLSNGDILISYRKNRPLSYAVRPEGILLSSEPLDAYPDWIEIPEDHYIYSSSPASVEVISGNVIKETIAET